MNEWRHVDALLELKRGERAVGEKLIRKEGFLEGHFPGRPIQPGVLTIEGLIEVAKQLIRETISTSKNIDARIDILRIEKAKFVDMVYPGEKLFLEVVIAHWDDKEVRFNGKALVEESLKAEATFALSLFETD
jgi:3-hydroxyacyl-[acyl-carrier-protein] dehydratase